MTTLIYDLETDDLLEGVTRIHCIVTKDLDTGEICTFNPKQIEAGITKLVEADALIAHNGLGYDDMVVKKLFGIDIETTYDTLVMSRTTFPHRKELDFDLLRKGKLPKNMIGRHSLESWGYRLGFLKGDYGKQENAWLKYSPEMLEYCIQDVEVTEKLFKTLMSKGVPDSVFLLESKVHQICLKQTENGFPFDFKRAISVHGKMLTRKTMLTKEIKKVLGGVFIHNLGEVITKKTVKYKDISRGHFFEGAPYTKIKIVEFNPTSRVHVANRLVSRVQWEPTTFNTDGTPEVSEATIKTIKHPIGKLLQEQFMLQKRLGMMADGRFGWMKLVANDGAIHGRVNTMGTQTSRCSHSSPNLAQIPSVHSPWGKECRSCFYAPEGWELFGTDASGLELRCLAHYMGAFDKGAYAEIILNGDIHTVNQKAMGVETRSQAKTVCYATLYGAGVEHIGELLGAKGKHKAVALGTKIRNNFYKGVPALGKLSKGVKAKAKALGYLKGLDGRSIPVRSQHSALNFLLQSAGAIICKTWVVNIHSLLEEAGYIEGEDYKQVAFVHDEVQILFKHSQLKYNVLADISAKAMTMAEKSLNIRMQLNVDCCKGANYAETH